MHPDTPKCILNTIMADDAETADSEELESVKLNYTYIPHNNMSKKDENRNNDKMTHMKYLIAGI